MKQFRILSLFYFFYTFLRSEFLGHDGGGFAKFNKKSSRLKPFMSEISHILSQVLKEKLES